MDTGKLWELLTIVQDKFCIYGRRWNDVQDLVACIKQENIEPIKKEWADKWKQSKPEYYPLDLFNMNTWSTYEDCVDLRFYIRDDFPNIDLPLFMCEAKVYDGEMLDGRRKGLRFTAVFQLPDSYLKVIEDKIMYAIDKMATEAYEDHLLNEERKWKENYKFKVLGITPEKVEI